MNNIKLYYILLLCAFKGFNAQPELEEPAPKIKIEAHPGSVKLENKITNIQNAFRDKSDLILKDASLQIRIIEEAAKRQREDTQRDISEEEKIIIEETHFTDVEFLIKHCSGTKNEATGIMLQNSIGGIRTCTGLAKKKSDIEQVLFDSLYTKLGLTEEELKKLQKKCHHEKYEVKQNCFFEKIYASDGPVINLFLRMKEAEIGLQTGEEQILKMKTDLIQCSEIVQLNMKEDSVVIIDSFKTCCANVVNRTKLLLKLAPNKKEK